MDLCPLSFWTTTSDSPPGLWLDGGGQSATGSCTDNAGNTASVTASGIDIDQTAPTAAPHSIVPVPNAGGWKQNAGHRESQL